MNAAGPMPGTVDSPAATSSARRLLALRSTAARWTVAVVTLAVLVLVVLPVIVNVSPNELGDAPLSPPSTEHIFGTDQVGRDVAARVLHGAQTSAVIAALAAFFALAAGALLGAAAAIGPRWVDEVIMRITDVGLAFPGILLAIVLAAVIGPSQQTTIIVLAVLYAPAMARVVRAGVYSELGEDYVLSARLIGTRKGRLAAHHISRNAALPILVFTTIITADAILAEAALSFLGAGVKPPQPSLGNIISDGRSVIFSGAWWISLFPGLAIVLAVLGLNRYAEALGRALRS